MATLNIKNLPDPLYRKLQKRAREQHRSVAEEVTRILEAAVASPEPLAILELRGLGKEAWRGVDTAVVLPLVAPLFEEAAALSSGYTCFVTNGRDLPIVPGLNVVQLRGYLPA